MLSILGTLLIQAASSALGAIYETNVVVQTFAGSGFSGYVDGVGVQTMFNWPRAACLDNMTNLYVADWGNRRIRKVSPNGTVSTFAGSGEMAANDGQGTNASFYSISGLAADGNGNLFVADRNGIRKISPTGYVTTFAGNPLGGPGYSDGNGGNAAFASETSGLWTGLGIATDAQGNIYVADPWNHRIRKVSTNGNVTTFAGSGNSGFQDGTGIFTAFSLPTGITVDIAGNVYVADNLNSAIRKITPTGVVTTLAGGRRGYQDGSGTNAMFDLEGGSILTFVAKLAVDRFGNIYVSDVGNQAIRKVSPGGFVTTLAGGSQAGFADGEGAVARFNAPCDVVCDKAGGTFIVDSQNHRIRRATHPYEEVVSPSQLSMSLLPSISLHGIVGRFYRIEATTNVSLTNGWTTLTTVLLTSSPHLWVDTQSVCSNKRFYRAVLLP